MAGAMNVAATARDNDQIDRLIESSSRGVEKLCHRLFAPTLDTRYFDWPNDQMGRSYRLWLDQNELISASLVLAGGVEILAGNYFLEPVNYGPPYDRLELNIASTQGFNIGSTFQRNIAITGLYGHSDDANRIGTTSGTVNSTDTTVTVAHSGMVGVGSVLRVDDERIITTDRNYADTGVTVTADLDSLNSTTLVPVSAASVYAGEVILIDAEKMLITDVAGSNVVVKRAWDGSVLAAHTSGAPVYASRAFTALRGQLGTAAAAHSGGSVWTEWAVPGKARQLCIAETLNAFQQEQGAYARTVGSGATARNAATAGIEDIRDDCYRALGRKVRSRAI